MRTSATQAALLCLLLPCTFAQREDYEVQPWQFNKFWFWSSTAPMTKALDKFPDVVFGVKMILDHFERVERQVYARIGSRVPPDGSDLVKPCTSRDTIDWPRAVNSNLGMRGFPKPDLSCITDFTGVQLKVNDIPPYTVDQLYEATLNRGLAIQRNGKAIAETFIDVKNNYTGPDFVFNYPYNTTNLKCVLHPVHGVRADNKWVLATGIHNRPKWESLPLLERKVIVEYHRVVGGHLTDNYLMRLPVRPEPGVKGETRDDATTLIVNGRGHANPSMYRFLPIAENPAMLESLDFASIYIQQVEGAVTPSNIAILVLPLALNIVPITCFAHVSTMKMLLYLIFTDALTVIPLLIKGIELIEIQSMRYRAIVLRITSASNTNRSEAAAAEMWASECQALESIRDIGIIFVVVSVVFMILGVVLELGAREYLIRRRRRVKLASELSVASSSSGYRADEAWWGDTSEYSAGYISAEAPSGEVYLRTTGGDRYSVDTYPESRY